MKVVFLLFLSFFSFSLANLVPLFEVEKSAKIQDQYIVVFQENATTSQLTDHLSVLKLSFPNVEIHHVYQHSIKGYSAKLNEASLSKLRFLPEIAYIEEDQVMVAFQTCKIQENPEWNLDRISSSGVKLSSRFVYPDNSGEGVDAYVIDTGVYCEHNDFQGRCSFGFKASSSWTNLDANGHGTHVASTIAGVVYGVAKKATIIAVKVLGDNGSGTNSGVIAGVDYSAGNAKKTKKPSVANMSLGGGASTALDDAVNKAVTGGLFLAVAAGNSNADASNYSPARAANVLCVGSAEIANKNNIQEDKRSSFSNWGPRIDIFAPGTQITAAWIGDVKRVNTISGTSMASPHVAGVAALFVKDFNSPALLKSYLIDLSEKDDVDLACSSATCKLTPKRYLYSPC